MCVICHGSVESVTYQGIKFEHCLQCGLLRKVETLSLDKEFDRYQLHHNGNSNEYYRYQKEVCDKISPFLATPHLDFGCGDGHVLANILSSAYYDKFFYSKKPNQNFRSVSAIEVVEHFRNIEEDWKELLSFGESGSTFIIMTQMLTEKIDPNTWWYLRDYTHYVFYTFQSFQCLAQKLNFKILYTNYQNFIVFRI